MLGASFSATAAIIATITNLNSLEAGSSSGSPALAPVQKHGSSFDAHCFCDALLLIMAAFKQMLDTLEVHLDPMRKYQSKKRCEQSSV
jgi:zona occludens toxin (predicted ATPase)